MRLSSKTRICIVLLCLVEEFGESDKLKSLLSKVFQNLWDGLSGVGFDIVAEDDFTRVWCKADIFIDDFGICCGGIGGGDCPVETCPFSRYGVFVEVRLG